MPMIDVYAPVGVFADQHALARSLTTTLMAVEGVPDIVMFRRYTAAFVHELSADAIANVDGASNYVRVQVLTNASALNRDKQLAVVNKLSEVSASAAGDPLPPERIWVLLTEAPDSGWGLWGHAHTNTDLAEAAHSQLAEPTSSHASAGPMATKAPKSSAPQPSSPPTPPNADA